MKLIINGKPEAHPVRHLAELLDRLGHRPDGVATALNGSFVPASQRETQPLKEGDLVEIVAPMQGG